MTAAAARKLQKEIENARSSECLSPLLCAAHWCHRAGRAPGAIRNLHPIGVAVVVVVVVVVVVAVVIVVVVVIHRKI